MAKKSGMSLNPGADATLVQAATNAAMANVPKDLSGTFESMAEEYGKTMKIVGESFGSLAKNLGEVGGQLVGKAIKEIRTEDENMSVLIEKEIEIEGSQIGDDPVSDKNVLGKKTQTTSLGQELRDIRKELSSLFLRTDPESRKRKAELRAKKDSYYSEIALLKQENDANNQLLVNENVNLEATGSLNLALNLAIKDYKTKDGKIKEGPYKGYSAALSRNEDGDLSWTLKDPSGKHVTGRDPQGNLITTGNKPYKVALSEMSKTLTPKMDQTTVDSANKIINSAFTSGKQGVDYMGNQLVGKFRTLLDSETSLQQLADVRLGDDTKTLREHVNSESERSAEIFAELSSVDLASIGVDEMADGKAGYTEADFVGNKVAVSNFEKVRSATFDKDNDNYDNGSYLKKLTEKHIYRIGEIMHGVGNKLYTPPKGTTTTTTNPFGTKSIQIGNTWLSANDRLARRKIIEAGKGGFTGVYGDYAPTKDGWTRDQGDGPKPINTYQMMQDEQLVVAGDVDPSIKQKEQKLKTTNYLTSDLVKLVGNITDEEQLKSVFNEKYNDQGFTFDWKYDGEEAIFVSFKGGEEKKFLITGGEDIAAKVAAYMNFKNPKDGATMAAWPGEGKNKGKPAFAKGGEWFPVKK